MFRLRRPAPYPFGHGEVAMGAQRHRGGPSQADNVAGCRSSCEGGRRCRFCGSTRRDSNPDLNLRRVPCYPLHSTGRTKWWIDGDSNPDFLGANQTTSHWSIYPKWSTPAESNRAIRVCSPAPSQPARRAKKFGTPDRNRTCINCVRSAAPIRSATQGHTVESMERTAGIEPVSFRLAT